VLLVALAVAPGLFWLWYFLKHDRLKPEPQALIRRVYLLGALSAIPAAVLEAIAFFGGVPQPQSGGFQNALIAASLIGVVEEAVKFCAVYYGVYRRAEFDEVMDGIVYCVAASMGFATLENLLYVLSGGVGVGVIRAVLSVPGHAFFGALMGFHMGRAKFAGPAASRWLLAGVAIAALAHAAFDAVLFTRTWLALAVLPLNVFLWRRSLLHSRAAAALDDARGTGVVPGPGGSM
jgi:RsiW-degrading membrane proteinase PrsW (M82 family)